LVGTTVVFKKELADHLTSQRIVIISILIYIISISMAYSSVMGIWENLKRTEGANVFLQLFTTQSDLVPSFLGFMAFFGPIIGLILVFDAVNRERSQGTVGIVLSQPIYKDSLLIGKFAATSATILLIFSTVIIFVTGIGIATLGTLPTLEEVYRLIAFLLLTGVYLSFWVGLGLFFSIIFKREGTSALASIATWLFFTIFYYMAISLIQGTGGSIELMYYLSPSEIYTTASNVIMQPTMRVLGPVSYETIIRMIPNPLPLGESLLLIWPDLTALIAGMILIFIVSYVVFIKQEIRST
jgi:ABC-2 type transport system permease protein